MRAGLSQNGLWSISSDPNPLHVNYIHIYGLYRYVRIERKHTKLNETDALDAMRKLYSFQFVH